MFLSILFICLVVGARGDCFYDNMFPEEMAVNVNPPRYIKEPMGLAVMSDATGTRFNTIQKCEDYCNAHHWCFAISNHPRPNEHFCQFHTDMSVLGIYENHFNCGNKNEGPNHGCVLSDTVFLNLDNEVFKVVNKDSFGFKIHEKILPSRIQTYTGSSFCKVLKDDSHAVHSTPSKLHSQYYGTKPVSYGIWGRGGPPSDYAKHGNNPAVSGFPIVGMSASTEQPLQAEDGKLFIKYGMFRHVYSQQKECMVTVDNVADKHSTIHSRNFFYIKQLQTDNSYRYLNCVVIGQNHQELNGCSWDLKPDIKWTVGEFNLPHEGPGPDFDLHQHQNKTLIAYKGGKELGWLRRNQCRDDTPWDHGAATGLLPGGKDTNNGGKVHCGAKSWGFVRNGGGFHGGLMCMFDYKDHTFSHGTIQPCFTGHTTPNERNWADMCSLDYGNWAGPENACKNGHFYNTEYITVENADDVFDGKLYEIRGKNGLKMYCDRFTTKECTWVTGSGQLFKFDDNGVSNSEVNHIKDHLTHQKQSMSIYEKEGGFWIHVGYVKSTLTLTENYIVGAAGIKLASDGTIVVGSGDKIIQGSTSGERVTVDKLSAANGVNAGDPITVNVDYEDKYKWVSDSETCPDNYYLHQVRCAGDSTCNKFDFGCVKDNDNCKLNKHGGHTRVKFKWGQTVECPDGEIAVGRGHDELYCRPVNVTSIKPAGHSFPTTPDIGFFVTNSRDYTSKSLPTDNLWRGEPIQGINVFSETLKTWTYGKNCFVNQYDSTSVVAGAIPKSTNVVGQHVSCDDPNAFITFIKCTGVECRAGVEFFCDTMHKCPLTGDNIRVNSSTIEQPVCPFGMVMTGLTCIEHELHGGKYVPCGKVEITCKQVEYSASAPPTPRPAQPPSEGGSLKTILISLGVGLPLLIVAAIVCLFCIPDSGPALSAPAISPPTPPETSSAQLRRRRPIDF